MPGALTICRSSNSLSQLSWHSSKKSLPSGTTVPSIPLPRSLCQQGHLNACFDFCLCCDVDTMTSVFPWCRCHHEHGSPVQDCFGAEVFIPVLTCMTHCSLVTSILLVTLFSLLLCQGCSSGKGSFLLISLLGWMLQYPNPNAKFASCYSWFFNFLRTVTAANFSFKWDSSLAPVPCAASSIECQAPTIQQSLFQCTFDGQAWAFFTMEFLDG